LLLRPPVRAALKRAQIADINTPNTTAPTTVANIERFGWAAAMMRPNGTPAPKASLMYRPN
jgi:hypothetical protein